MIFPVDVLLSVALKLYLLLRGESVQ
uniref:Uncharacterized protein n=1 Tax=Rhizophora mucronata TaxID=61149 RepID=A0A2P2ND15_RHIMU